MARYGIRTRCCGGGDVTRADADADAFAGEPVLFGVPGGNGECPGVTEWNGNAAGGGVGRPVECGGEGLGTPEPDGGVAGPALGDTGLAHCTGSAGRDGWGARIAPTVAEAVPSCGRTNDATDAVDARLPFEYVSYVAEPPLTDILARLAW